MIIGVDVSALGEKNTGTSRYINCLLSSLKTTGNEITTFPASHLNRQNKTTLLNSIPFIKRGGIERHLYRTFKLGEDMETACVDIGIFPNYLMPVKFSKPSIIVIHDLSFYSNPEFYSKAFVLFYKNQLRKTLEKNPLVATVSEYSKENIQRYLGVNKEKIFLLQPFIDKDVFLKKQFTDTLIDNELYFLYVGHIEPRKNLGFLIRNFIKWKKLNKINIKLKIAGELWLNSKEIRRLLTEYKQHPDIIFTGYVDEDRLHQLYMNAAGFVHTSLVEGFGLPVLEAMHYGLPVLCSSGISTEEITKPDSITVNPKSDSELLDGFDRLLLKSLLKNPYEDIPYSPQLMGSQLDAILEVVSEKKKMFYFKNKPAAEIETAIERTLMYYKIFNSGLDIKLIHSLLLDIKASPDQIKEALLSLIEKNIVSLSDNILSLNAELTPFYIPKGRSINKRNSLRLLKILNLIPFISFVAFSGGTAIYGLENHDDMDLFIITKPYTVYIVYLLLHMISLVLKSRNILCINYLIDEKAIVINVHNDLYTAHQILTLKPVRNVKFLNHFLKNNTWVTDYYPNFKIQENGYKPGLSLHYFYRPFNWVLQKLYRYRYRKPIRDSMENSVMLTENIIKLHTQDYRKKVIEEFETQWLKYLENKTVNSFSRSAVK